MERMNKWLSKQEAEILKQGSVYYSSVWARFVCLLRLILDFCRRIGLYPILSDPNRLFRCSSFRCVFMEFVQDPPRSDRKATL